MVSPTGPTLVGTIAADSTLIVVALEQEARYFATEHPVLVTGVGKVAAALAVAEVLSGARPARVVNVGTAGGLRPGLSGTVEVGRVVQHDFDDDGVFALTGRHDGPGLDLGLAGAPVLATGDRFVAGGPERERAAAVADLVDMEGYAVAAAARRAGVPVRVVKHVSDPAEEGSLATWSESVDACARLLAGWVHAEFPSEPVAPGGGA